MLKDITLGQYYSEDSIIHRLDPRVKLVGTVLFMISLFLFNNALCYLFAFIFLLSVIIMSRVPLKYILRGMKSIFILLLITVVYNLFMTPGEEVISIWKIKITYEGICSAIFMFCRLSLLIIGSSVMTFTTTPGRLTDGLESLFNPLRLFKVPVHELAMMMSIAIRFIPILLDETDKIMKAQIARGAELESRNFIKKIKSLIPILVPLFISSFKRASDLALAMEARGYRGGAGRTKLRPLKYQFRDFCGYVVLALYIALIIAGGFLYNYFTGLTIFI